MTKQIAVGIGIALAILAGGVASAGKDAAQVTLIATIGENCKMYRVIDVAELDHDPTFTEPLRSTYSMWVTMCPNDQNVVVTMQQR